MTDNSDAVLLFLLILRFPQNQAEDNSSQRSFFHTEEKMEKAESLGKTVPQLPLTDYLITCIFEAIDIWASASFIVAIPFVKQFRYIYHKLLKRILQENVTICCGIFASHYSCVLALQNVLDDTE